MSFRGLFKPVSVREYVLGRLHGLEMRQQAREARRARRRGQRG